MGPTWGLPGSCWPQLGPFCPHEPCYQGSLSSDTEMQPTLQQHVQVQVQVQIKFIATQKIHITATFTNIIAHMVHMVKEGTWVFYKKYLHNTVIVPIQVICWDASLKGKSSVAKGVMKPKSGLWAPNLLNSVESYAVCMRVKVAEPVQISYTG